jgi:aspartokinase/homoserine dehydrogenase 1
MRVLKFGGSSVKTPERIKNVIAIIDGIRKEHEVAVVFSAFGGITDMLIDMTKMAAAGNEEYLNLLREIESIHRGAAEELLKGPELQTAQGVLSKKFKTLSDILHGVFLLGELSLRTLDLVMSFGEILSNCLIAACMRTNGIDAEYCDASKLVKTDQDYGQAKVDYAWTNKNIQDHFAGQTAMQIITGFIASTPDNIITTLGRSGSDYTAAIFAAALDADEIEIWTDVDGVMTTDPRKVVSAFSIDRMTYEEAMEMSHFGSKVIHPKVMQPALEKNIPIRIKNTFNPGFIGTVIGKEQSEQPYAIRGISSISHIALVTVEGSGMIGVAGISARLFTALARENINIILISQSSSEHSICFAVVPHAAEKSKRVVEAEFEMEIRDRQIERVKVEEDLAILAVVGQKMKGTPGIAAKVFHAIGKFGINVVAIAQGSSELNVSVVIPNADEENALNAIHEEFFIKTRKSVHVFLVGVGLVGGKLLEQIEKQAAFLHEQNALDIKINGIANSKRMLFSPKGIDLKGWREQLNKSTEKLDFIAMAARIKELNFRQSVFVDCTASEEITDHYKRLLEFGVSIVTPNKKANSGGYEVYKNLKEIAFRRGVRFLYETNVGASLPILSTLSDMILSGDKILKIETIISGTISYIFNAFVAGKKFSSVVKEARERGYTEPDPRDDLNGKDVARKLLILAREIGLTSEYDQISVENILPEPCQKAPGVEAFFFELEKSDQLFDDIRSKAETQGKVLRYIATLNNGTAKVALESIDNTHPFYHLHGNENIIAITTERYREKPIVIKGPGAGADVTAAGVFADIIRIGNS